MTRTTRHTLLCTVGTSLLDGNLRRLTETTPKRPDNWEVLRHATDERNWPRVAAELLRVPPDARVCGAEINTIEHIRRRKDVDLQRIVFLVSDTEAGRDTGEVLRRYFEAREDLALEAVEVAVIEALQDERPWDFKQHGLRNLVRKMGRYIREYGQDYLAIDATGGYKAQIAIAALVGQALGVPVFYKHERFGSLIDFPPMPVAFDYALLGEHAGLLAALEKGVTLTEAETGPIPLRLRVLLTDVCVDGQTLYELSPIGQIFVESYRARHPKPVTLPSAQDRRPPRFRDDHYPAGFKEFVEKVWRENEWIVSAHSRPYDKQKGIAGIGFNIQPTPEGPELIGTYHRDFGARFRILLAPDATEEQLTHAAVLLNERYGS
ncbi:MAG: putative CRISPR-associated protein [Deltaproteobacteria bacterium]|nr:MAG: putative CRISPR-associated protein [Deltaproteobacteria bacterium]